MKTKIPHCRNIKKQ